MRIELSENQVEVLLKSQEEKIQKLEDEEVSSFEISSMRLDFIESLGVEKIKEYVEFAYKTIPDFARDAVEYFDVSGIVELNKIPCSAKDFKAWDD